MTVTMTVPADIPSPCVRNCCLNNDDICLGCYRSLREICIWRDASAEEKQNILQACEMRKQDKNNPTHVAKKY